MKKAAEFGWFVCSSLSTDVQAPPLISSDAPVSPSAGRLLSTVAMQGQLSAGSLASEGHGKKVNTISVFQPVYLAHLSMTLM